MSYLAKSLFEGQSIIVRLCPEADREDMTRRLSLDGIRFKVLTGAKPGAIRIGCTAPHGLIPSKIEGTPERRDDVGCLALARSVGDSVVVTLQEGADAVLDWLASDGLVFKLNQIKTGQAVYHVIAHDGLLVLREELATG
ncbi:hypothetical protein [Pseudomonas sp. XK-1]|uniref:hypothetical protein n=1 Tax=Pseudomonas sp. XK-1 TaxID=3136019 RepID=UPI003119ED03